jgi:acyl carrier protein
MTIEDSLKKYIANEFFFSDDVSVIGEDDSLVDKGVIDSTGVLELIMFIEDTFNIKVNDDEMVPENLDSINLISKFVSSKQ